MNSPLVNNDLKPVTLTCTRGKYMKNSVKSETLYFN